MSTPSAKAAAIDFDTSLPSVRQVQTLIKEKVTVELKLVTGDLIIGTFLWQDPVCVCVLDQANQQTTIWKQAVAYIKPQG